MPCAIGADICHRGKNRMPLPNRNWALYQHLLPIRINMIQTIINNALCVAYPTTDAWRQLGPQLVDELDIDNVFYRKGQPPVAVLYMDYPYVDKTDMLLAQHLQMLYGNRMNGRQLNVMLVYVNLLVRPQDLPKGLYILSVALQEKPTHHNQHLN